MAIYYLDASALVKYYVREPGSAWVRELVDVPVPATGARVNTILISEASIAETGAAFTILCRTQRISRSARNGVFGEFMSDITRGRFNPVVVISTDFRVAAYLTQQHPLKAYDAVQLAVALREAQGLARRSLSLTFIAGDGQLLAAAIAEGLATENPFDHVSSQDT